MHVYTHTHTHTHTHIYKTDHFAFVGHYRYQSYSYVLLIDMSRSE